MKVRSLNWKISKPGAGLEIDDLLNITDTAIEVTRPGTPTFTWGENFNRAHDPATVCFGSFPHQVEDDGRRPGVLNCNLNRGKEVVWTAQENTGSSAIGRGEQA